MTHERTFIAVRDALCGVFTEVDGWFDRDDAVRGFRPLKGRWSIDQVLEHIALTNHYLILTLRKLSKIAERRANRGISVATAESDLDRLLIIGQRGTFQWDRPEHMEPTGLAPCEVRDRLRQQLGECLILLERLRGGRGALCRITMTVDRLGKIDLYQWLYFLAQHARRHLPQLAELEAEFRGL